jgi:ABC-2 type transport system permease protein
MAQPMLFLVAFGFGFGPVYQRAGGGDYIQFLAPGIIAMSVLFISVFSGIELVFDRQFGFLKETLAAPVARRTIMIGKTLGGATVAVFQGTLVFALTLAVGFRPTDWLMVPVALLFLFLIALLFTSLGMAIATQLTDMHAFPLIMNFLVMPAFFLSGALFPIEQLPPALKTAVTLDPLSYGVDAVRLTLIGQGHFGFGLDAAVLIGGFLILQWIGGFLFERVEI